MPRRIEFHNWVYETLRPDIWGCQRSSPRQERIKEAVREELEKLSADEREFVELYWFQGKSTAEIGRYLGRKGYMLDGLNKCIIRKLKSRLADFARREFNIKCDEKNNCVICSHPNRAEINMILRAKRPQDTFKEILESLKENFELKNISPQAIIGHMKYHMKEES